MASFRVESNISTVLFLASDIHMSNIEMRKRNKMLFLVQTQVLINRNVHINSPNKIFKKDPPRIKYETVMKISFNLFIKGDLFIGLLSNASSHKHDLLIIFQSSLENMPILNQNIQFDIVCLHRFGNSDVCTSEALLLKNTVWSMCWHLWPLIGRQPPDTRHLAGIDRNTSHNTKWQSVCSQDSRIVYSFRQTMPS